MSIADKAMKLKDGQILYNDLRNRQEKMLLVQDAQPTDPETKVWISSTQPNSVQVPSYAEHTALMSAINVLEPAATSSDVGKFLKAKTVSDGKVTEYEFGSASGGGVRDVQVNGTSVVTIKRIEFRCKWKTVYSKGIEYRYKRFLG